MRSYDFSPLFRSTVGFDRLANLMNAATQTPISTTTYPPYNIEKLNKDSYLISIAVAGFSRDEIRLEVTGDKLLIEGRVGVDESHTDRKEFLHQGIAGRPFRHKFQLADHIKITNATLLNGMLNIELARHVPDELKPREIKISSGNKKQLDKAA